MSEMRPVFILAGGFGTRLSKVVKDVPKPLAPVCGSPFLKYLLINCVEQGFTEIVLLLHYKAEKFESIINELKDSGMLNDVKILSIIETKPLGTAGSILNALKKHKYFDSFMVINADTWLGGGLQELNASGPNSLLAVEQKDCSRYGSIEIENGFVKKFKEKTELKSPGWISAGAYCMTSSVFFGYESQDYISMEKDILPRLTNDHILKAVKSDIDFIDIGMPEEYFRFCKWIESGRENDL